MKNYTAYHGLDAVRCKMKMLFMKESLFEINAP